MLILGRRVNEAVIVRVGDSTVRVMVTGIRGNTVKLGFKAPQDAEILREEIVKKKEKVGK